MPATGLSRAEAGRKAAHVAFGGLAFLLRATSWPEAAAIAAAAFVFNWQLLPRLGGRRLWRPAERERGYASGVLLYPLCVLGLILAFRYELWKAAAVWSILAWGDGMASVVGQVVGGARLPWNPRKTWAGSVAFLVFGSAGASLLTAWTLRLPLAAWSSGRILEVIVPVVFACALVESLPVSLDDNVSVAFVGGVLVAVLSEAELSGLFASPDLLRRAAGAVALNATLAVLARSVGALDMPGCISAALVGASITSALGLPGLAVLAAFFVLGSGATRLGHALKTARGIAERGARGWRNVWANGGVATLLAIVAGLAAAEARKLLVLAYVAALATAAADTCASEIGKAYGRRAWLITKLARVRAGTQGAISLEGTLAGLAGACIVALVGGTAGLYAGRAGAIVAASGFVASVVESLLGAASGARAWPSNHVLNLFNTAVGAGIALVLARFIA